MSRTFFFPEPEQNGFALSPETTSYLSKHSNPQHNTAIRDQPHLANKIESIVTFTESEAKSTRH